MTIWDNESARRTVRYNLPCHDQRPFQVAAIQAAGLIDFVFWYFWGDVQQRIYFDNFKLVQGIRVV
jgi:hypothetical protein